MTNNNIKAHARWFLLVVFCIWITACSDSTSTNTPQGTSGIPTPFTQVQSSHVIFATMEDLLKPMKFARDLLPAHVKNTNHLPYLGPLLDAGMAAILSFEVQEALRHLNEPGLYHPFEEPDLENGKIWLGAADDVIMRKRGVEFVDGSAPGFAAIVGAAPNPEIAKMIAEDYQKKNLYVFMCANQAGTTFTETTSGPVLPPSAPPPHPAAASAT